MEYQRRQKECLKNQCLLKQLPMTNGSQGSNQGSMLEIVSFRSLSQILCARVHTEIEFFFPTLSVNTVETESVYTSNKSLLKGWMVGLDDFIGRFQPW